jgi:hypothetical protein
MVTMVWQRMDRQRRAMTRTIKSIERALRAALAFGPVWRWHFRTSNSRKQKAKEKNRNGF